MANCHKTKKEWETTTEVFDEGHDWLSALADLFFFIVGLSTQLYYTGKNENANIIKVHKSWCFLKSRPLGWLMTTTLLAYFQKLVDLWEFWLECPSWQLLNVWQTFFWKFINVKNDYRSLIIIYFLKIVIISNASGNLKIFICTFHFLYFLCDIFIFWIEPFLWNSHSSFQFSDLLFIATLLLLLLSCNSHVQ